MAIEDPVKQFLNVAIDAAGTGGSSSLQLKAACLLAAGATDGGPFAEESYLRLGILGGVADAVAGFLGTVAKELAPPCPWEICLESVEIVLRPGGSAQDVKNLRTGFHFIERVVWWGPQKFRLVQIGRGSRAEHQVEAPFPVFGAGREQGGIANAKRIWHGKRRIGFGADSGAIGKRAGHLVVDARRARRSQEAYCEMKSVRSEQRRGSPSCWRGAGTSERDGISLACWPAADGVIVTEDRQVSSFADWATVEFGMIGYPQKPLDNYRK
jgi:hypothetical protein